MDAIHVHTIDWLANRWACLNAHAIHIAELTKQIANLEYSIVIGHRYQIGHPSKHQPVSYTIKYHVFS